MDKFDLIVIGAGAGLHVASAAAKKGWGVALIDHGPIGGVCLNTGCTPSKILIYPADVVRNLEGAAEVGIEGEISKKDFQRIMSRMHSFVHEIDHLLNKAGRLGPYY